ncbi:MAG: hypothetical protein Kow0069_18830 [Promethearchaeota archaeon]
MDAIPTGVVLIKVDPETGPALYAEHFEDPAKRVTCTKDFLLKVQLGHSDKVQNTLLHGDVVFVSHATHLKDHSFIVGVFLEATDKPESFVQGLKNAAKTLEQHQGDSPEEVAVVLEDVFSRLFKTPTVALDIRSIDEHVKEKTKQLLKAGKTSEAQALLQKVKQKVPQKLHSSAQKAQKAINKGDFDRAVRLYLEAAQYAEELEEGDLVKLLKDKAKLAKKIPELLERRDQFASEARKNLREEKFNRAALYYKKAADVSKELMDPEATEEFVLKANALAEFAKVDSRFRRKKEDA